MSHEDVADKKDTETPSLSYQPESLPSEGIVKRPPISFASPSAFIKSVGRRFKSIWTRRFALSLLAGQVTSLCITCTNVATTELVNRNWALPTTQSFFLYFSLFLIYIPYTIYRYGFKGWAEMIFRDGWRYFILAAADVEANFMVVMAYQYTDLLSCMLLDTWAIPVCLFFSWLYMRTRYHWTQILGVLVCIGGMGMIVASDMLTDKNWEPLNRGKGDAFMIAGATLYGFTNATEEFLVRKRPLYEVLGQLGFWGFLICGAQAAGLEHEKMKQASWNAGTVGLFIAFTCAMLILYTVAPLLYRMASSLYYNLSMLSSDFYGLLFGLFLYHYTPFWLYFIGFVVILVGLVTYFWSSTPEDQGTVDPQTPEYVQRRIDQRNANTSEV